MNADEKKIMSLFDDTQADIIEAFNSTSRYLDDLLKIDNPYFEGMNTQMLLNCNWTKIPVSILRKSISGRHRAVRVADGPMTARCRFT